MRTPVMAKVSLRSLAAHKIRLILTVFSVVLGTSFVAAAVVFTATVQSSFDNIFDNVARGVDVQVSAAQAQSPGVPVEVVDQLREQRGQLGIDKLQVDFSGPVTIATADGSGLQTGGAPSIGSSYIPPDQAVDAAGMKLVAGRAPTAPFEVVLNQSAAQKAQLTVGSKTVVALGTGTSRPIGVTVVGLLDMPAATGGFVNVQFERAQAEQLFGGDEFVSAIDMTAAPGVSDTQLRDRLDAMLNAEAVAGKGEALYQVRTGEQVREDQKDQIGTVLTVLRYVLLAFAAIGLIVGTFIIYNTFSMIVAQRNRELALLRAIGASRPNISRSVLLEALVVGILGGAIGLGLGVGIAALMLVYTSGQGLPSAGLQVGVGAVLSAVFVGVIVTLLSAWFPAQRAARVPPVEAMRMSSAEPGAGSLRTRTIIGGLLALAGIGLLAGGVATQGVPALLLIGGAAVLIIVAVVLAAPALSQPVVGGIGRVLQIPFATVGKLARTNAIRNPRRSAATAFALTIGLILVVVIGTIGASFKTMIDAEIDQNLRADFVVSGGQAPMSSAVGEAVAQVPDAQTTVSFDMAFVTLDGERTAVSTPVGGAMSEVMNIGLVDGVEQLGPDGMLVSEKIAADHGWTLGSRAVFVSTTGVEVPVTVTGLFVDNPALGDWLVGNQAFDRLTPSQAARMTFVVLVKGKPGVSESALREQLEEAVKPFLTAQVQDSQQFKNSFTSIIDSIMATLYALLGLALVIAILGIINTLALSVVERRQEIGMLRAIGMSRPQLRRTIYLESVYIAIFGALLGVIVGLALGLPLVHALRHWGFDVITVPWPLIGITLAGSAVVGVVAALWPAVSAARTKPLEAITE
ncbi:putative ABC transporter permease protein [Gordonia hirsuta DSM 44140 = NBRC 16056]|uniref:Putative ABC transporter permease protein n=1 Tax=Gordonia hirsuta DSM 44140 = NBRC 16056 TaxID=1121927 RepID=L7LF80_9ACTN|nr:ABC transporter permease [Gordonia hirsuta]GAC58737.1 putative ABC transporter permease protein [Gordonia hirsuta DSM 44140 = NBRC 16056]